MSQFFEKARAFLTGVPFIEESFNTRGDDNGPYASANDNRFREKTWLGAIAGDADSILQSRRPTMVRRCRHEYRNNAYVRGQVKTAANYIVGRGPRFRVRTDNEKFNADFEKAWTDWSLVADYAGRYTLGEMLHLSEMELFTAGEYFWHHRLDPLVDGINLRYQMIDPDRVCSPGLGATTRNDFLKDGFEFDSDGRLIKIWVANRNPGDTLTPIFNDDEFTKLDPDMIIHEGNWERPEQTRGTPHLQTVLNLATDHRRYKNATILAAEAAAQISLYIQTQAGYIATAEFDPEDPEIADFDPGSVVTMPAGYEMSQVKPEHPATTHEMFAREGLRESGSGLMVPRNISAMDSSDHSYAGGRLDLQSFRRNNDVRREEINDRVLRRRIIPAFAEQFAILNGVSQELMADAMDNATLIWDGEEHIDPLKEAMAEKIRLENRTTNRTLIAAKNGLDYEQIEKQRQREDEKIPESAQPDNSGFQMEIDEDTDDADERTGIKLVS